MFHYNHAYSNAPPQPTSLPHIPYVSQTLKMLYDEIPQRIHFCAMCGGPLSAEIDVNIGNCLKDEKAERRHWEGNNHKNINDSATASSDEDIITSAPSKWFERFRGIVVKNHNDWAFTSNPDVDSDLDEYSEEEDSDMGDISDDDGNGGDGILVLSASTENVGGGSNGTNSPSTPGSPPTAPKKKRNRRTFSGISTRLTGVGYVSESESEFGVLPHGFGASITPDNDDGSEEEYQFYTAVNDNAERGIEMIPVHEHCWEEFMKAMRYWCEDAGVKLYDGVKWWLSSDVVWRFFTVGYWDSAVDERLQMVRWAYGRRIVENHEKGRWEVRKGEGWWLSEPSEGSILQILKNPPLLAIPPTHPMAPSSQLTPSSCPPSLTSPIHYPPSSNDIFNALPADIALNIFTFLPARDICNLRISSRPMAAVQLPQSVFRRILHTEYRFLSNTLLIGFLSGPQRYKVDWRAVLVLFNQALKVPGPFKNKQRIYKIIERLTEELCETAPRTLRQLRDNEVDWEGFTFTLHDGGLVRGYDVEDAVAETALFADDGVTRIRTYLNPETGCLAGLSFLGGAPTSERRFGVATILHQDIADFDKLLGFIVGLDTGSRITGVRFLLRIDCETVRTAYFGLPPDFNSGETGVGYYKLVVPRMFRQENLVGITGLCDQHGIRAIGLLAPLKVLQDEYLPLGDPMIMEMPSSSTAVYDETPMVRTYTGGDDDHKPVAGPWTTLDVPEGLINSVGSDCDVAFAGRVAGGIVTFKGVERVVGWWNDDGLKGLRFDRDGEEVCIGSQRSEICEEFILDIDGQEMIEGVIVTGGLREGAASIAFVTNHGRCSEFFGPKFVGCPTHFVPGRGPLARVDDRVVSALHYAYSDIKEGFTRLGVVAVIPATKTFGKGKGKEVADTAAYREHRELMLKSAQTILPFESRDGQGNLWEDVMPSANHFVIEKDKNRPDIIDGGWITWCGSVSTEKALRRVEVWGEVRGLRFTFVDGTMKGFGLVGKGDKIKTIEYLEPEGRWLVSCSWGKVRTKTSWAGEVGSRNRWDDAGYRDEEDLDDDDWDCTEVTEMKFRTRDAQGSKPKTLPVGYKFNHTINSIRGLAAIFSLPYAPQYLQKLPRPKVIYRSGHKHPTHPLYPNSTTIAAPPIPCLRKYEYEFFDGDNGEKLEAIIAYMGVGAWKPFKGLRFRREGSGWGDVFGEIGETMAKFELEGGRIERAFYRMGLGPWLDAVAFATATKASPYFGKERRGTEYEIPMDGNLIPIGVYSIRTQVTHVLGNYGPEGYIDHVKNQFGLLCRTAEPGEEPIRPASLSRPSPSSEPITEFYEPRCKETGRLWKSDYLSLPRNSRMVPLIRSPHFKEAIHIEAGDSPEALLATESKRTFALFDPERLKRIYVCWRYTTLPVCGRKAAAICYVKFRDFEKMDEVLIGDSSPCMNTTRIRSLTRNGEESGAKGWKIERIDIDGLGGERITQVRYVFNPWLCSMQLKTSFGRQVILGGLALDNSENEPYYDAQSFDVQDGEEITGMHVDTTWLVDRMEEKYCDKIGVILRPCVEV